MKNRSGREIWFERWFVFGLIPVSNAGIVLALGTPLAIFGLLELGDWLGAHGFAREFSASAYAAAVLTGLIGFGLAIRHSGSRVDALGLRPRRRGPPGVEGGGSNS